MTRGDRIEAAVKSSIFGAPTKVITEFSVLDLSQPDHRHMPKAVEPELRDGHVMVEA